MTVPVNLCALSHPFTPFLDGSNTKHLFFPFPLHTTRSDHLTPFQATECKWKDVVVLLASLAAPLVKRVLPSGQPCPLLAPRLGRKAANAADTLRPRRKCGGDRSLWPRALASVHCRKHATGCPTLYLSWGAEGDGCFLQSLNPKCPDYALLVPETRKTN